MNNGRIMDEIIICSGYRCSTWGKSWNRHLYTVKDIDYSESTGEKVVRIEKSETCFRCGMSRKEQWEEDKYCWLVTGAYVPLTPNQPTKAS